MMERYRTSAVHWKPSPVVALATSLDHSQIAAAREDGSLEIWLVSPGSICWHCHLTVHGDSKSRVSSLAWCPCPSQLSSSSGRLLSTRIDGSVYEWDLPTLNQQVVLESIGVSIWQMAVAPHAHPSSSSDGNIMNGHASNNDLNKSNSTDSDNEEDEDYSRRYHQDYSSCADETPLVALACDDGCIRLYNLTKSDGLVYRKSLPRVTGRVLSVTWSSDASFIYSGSSDGFIRCWDAKSYQEIYRTNVGPGHVAGQSDICIWSLLGLRNKTLVSADSSGSVQFWDSKHGTLLQAHSLHKGDAITLAAAPSHDRVFSAGSDGQVILYKCSEKDAGDASSTWNYVHSVRAHTHDVRALTVAMPITRKDLTLEQKNKRLRRRKKPLEFGYYKWANKEVPMLLSAGDDAKLLAYPAYDFTKFLPHDVCPDPQRVPIHFIPTSVFNQTPMLLSQSSHHLDIFRVSTTNMPAASLSSSFSWASANMNLLAQVNCKSNQKIICSAISLSGKLIAYSDRQKVVLLELRCEGTKSVWSIQRRNFPRSLPCAHSMIFTPNCSWLIIAGCDGMIHVVDVDSSVVVHAFTPRHEETTDSVPPNEPPITKLFTSMDGVWLSSVNCFGDICIFNLQTLRQHWFVSRLGGSAVSAGGFLPINDKMLVVVTSSNQVYVLDVVAKQLGDWSNWQTFVLPWAFQKFPGEVIGLSFHPSSSSTAIVYNARAMCTIDFGYPAAGAVDDTVLVNNLDSLKKLHGLSIDGKVKRKLKEVELETQVMKCEVCPFSDTVLFVGHISENSMLVVDKPWIEVVKSFDAPPVHRHIYGT